MATDVLQGTDGLTDLQKANWNLIVATGEKYGFSKEFINLVLEEAWGESRLGELAGSNGLFQYLPGDTKMWYELTQGGSSLAREVRDYLTGWGIDISKLVRTNDGHQTIVFFFEAAVLTNQFLNGTVSPGYAAAVTDLLKKGETYLPKSSYELQMLYIYATHHGPTNIGEVTTAWTTKLQPSLMKSLWYLKNPTGLLGNSDLDAMTWANALAEQVIPISSIGILGTLFHTVPFLLTPRPSGGY